MEKKCENCLWYFITFKLCYDQTAIKQPNETCPKWHSHEAVAKMDIRETTRAERLKSCDC